MTQNNKFMIKDAQAANMWEFFWTWAGRVPLRVKIIGITVSAMAVPGSAVVYWMWFRMPIQELSSHLVELVAIIGVSMIGGLAVAYLLTNILVHPILEITRVTRLVDQGDLTQRAPVWAEDEIGELGQSFNAMIQNLDSLLEEVKRKEALRSRLLASLVSAQEQERERISRELHDETGQALTALLVQIKVLEKLRNLGEVADQARELREIVFKTLEEVRRLAHDLRPSTLDNLGLIPTLDWYIRTYEQKTGVEVNFQVKVHDETRFPRHLELVIYRVLQEALTNIARHAQAAQVWIALEQEPDWVRLSVRDNGCGFNVERMDAEQDQGLGLAGIRERVELVGGHYHLDSQVGQGTCLQVEVACN
jgi:signal transduction histidine kinase